MKPSVLVTHEECLQHVTPPGHPEQVARLEYILEALKDINLAPFINDVGARFFGKPSVEKIIGFISVSSIVLNMNISTKPGGFAFFCFFFASNW